MADSIRNSLIAVVICSTGGAVFYLLHAPLPWLLGSLSAAAASAILGGRWSMPQAAGRTARPVVGLLAGSAFTAEVMAAAAGWSGFIALTLGLTVLMTLLGFLYFRKCAGFDRQTAIFAAAPGGIGEIALLSASLGGDVRSIVISHSLRVVLVVFSVPFVLQIIIGEPVGRVLPTSHGAAPPEAFDWIVLAFCGLAGYGLARIRQRFAAGFMVFPLLLSAGVHATGLIQAIPPPWLVAAVQIVIGGAVGARFAGIRWTEMSRVLVFAGVWALATVLMAGSVAYAATVCWDRSLPAMILALAPGGIAEMTILTFSIGIEVAFVATCQVVRVLFVILVTPFLFSVFAGPGGKT